VARIVYIQRSLTHLAFQHFEIALVAHNESSSVISHTAADKEAAQSRWDERIFRQSGDLVINDARGIHAFLTRVGDAFEVTSGEFRRRLGHDKAA